MISFVKGTVADIGENCLVVENGGIGYEIYMTGQDLGKARIGDEKKIHTFLYVREDILQLYGFFSKDDLGMFKLLMVLARRVHLVSFPGSVQTSFVLQCFPMM